MDLPKHILKALSDNRTSLGDHPAFPPEEEETFVMSMMKRRFDEVSEHIDFDNVDELKKRLGELVAECRKIESENTEALEHLCGEIVNEMFAIPENTLELEMNLVAHVSTDNQRMVPERTSDEFTFDDIDDFNRLSGEIYKRRMLDALVAGASMYYANDVSRYVQKLFSINSELPSLYKKILCYNDYLLFIEKESLEQQKNATEAGRVDVNMGSSQSPVRIVSEAIIFPILVEETIKGILELAIAHGLPTDKKKTQYIISKSDFKLAELWDMRLGFPLWECIVRIFEENDYDLEEIGVNFILMEIASLDTDSFNALLQNVFAHTRRGQQELCQLAENIIDEKDEDDFNDYISARQGEELPINDGYYTSEELLAEVDKY